MLRHSGHGMADPISPLQRYQYAFTAHIRDPRGNPRPAGVAAGRMRVYNELLYNNIEGFLLACFPVTRRILGKRRWSRLVRAFFAGHRCRTPFFRQIPEEFVQWLQAARASHPADPPFLAHLAHYEWVELAIDVSPAEPPLDRIDPAGDLLAGRPALNPVSMRLSYPYPVHRIAPRLQPQAPDAQPTCILVFRDLQDKVRFDVLNPVTARLLALLESGEREGRQALLQIAGEVRHAQPDVVVQGGRQILEDLRSRQAVLGTWR
jgi:uncharacterized protein